MLSEQMHKRLANRNVLLRELHFHGPLSRSEIAAACHIRKSSVTGLVAELLQEGMIRELEPGRLRSQLAISGDTQYVLCGFLDQSVLRLARVGLTGELSLQTDYPLEDSSPVAVMQVIRDAFRGCPETGRLGFSLAFSGIIDRNGQQVTNSAHQMNWNGFPVVEQLGKMLNAPVWLMNDIHCQMLACNWFRRELATCPNTLYIGIDQGIACRLTAQGYEQPGEHGAAGEIGHIRAGAEGRRCGCGKVDCLESYCSVPALCAAVNNLLPDYNLDSDAGALGKAAEKDLRVRNILDRETARLAGALVPIMAAVDPGCVLLATADVDFSDLLAGRLRQLLAVELAGILPDQAPVLVAPPVLGSTLQGAAVLPIRQLFCSSSDPNQG